MTDKHSLAISSAAYLYISSLPRYADIDVEQAERETSSIVKMYFAMRGLNIENCVDVVDHFQSRVEPWMDACFGREISMDRQERDDRLLEEVLELLQSADYPRDRINALIDYVYSRPKGEPHQETGGVMVTLAARCLAYGLDMHKAADDELARIWTKVDAIRAKQAAKPTGSALPVAVVGAQVDPEDCCIACGEPLEEGGPMYHDRDGGYLHAVCCGPEREGFYGDDEGPLVEGDPVPRPFIWEADANRSLKHVSDEVNDALCVDRFADAMKAKLRKAPEKGRGGWDEPESCSLDELSRMLVEHVRKGDPVDVANFAMMLHQRGGMITCGREAFRWIDEPIKVTGGDYEYEGQLLCSFPKEDGGQVRYIVRDQNRRLFIHNAQQCGLEG